ncbi:heavy-metal-associated domain-containing protein [Candidatus Pacearchaeota archaeon]|nr:heavy-metal-associated domain-containing protein [Candidatus Pacearchaeota archaeon]
MKKIKLKIEGMHCASCASNIEKSLKKISGIKEANVSLMMKKGFVEVEKEISDEELEKAVARTGYKLTGIERE